MSMIQAYFASRQPGRYSIVQQRGVREALELLRADAEETMLGLRREDVEKGMRGLLYPEDIPDLLERMFPR